MEHILLPGRPRSRYTFRGRAAGESEQRLYGLDAWEESPYYSERERAAFAWVEAITRITDGHVPDEVYDRVRPHFGEKELVDLTWVVAAIIANGLPKDFGRDEAMRRRATACARPLPTSGDGFPPPAMRPFPSRGIRKRSR